MRIGILAVACVLAAGCRADRGGEAQAGPVKVTHAVIATPTVATEATAFLLIENGGAATQTLVSITSLMADTVSIHQVVGGQMVMQQLVTIPGHARQRFVLGNLHLMLTGVHRLLTTSDTVPLTLQFAPAGSVVVRTPVMRYTEAVSEVP